MGVRTWLIVGVSIAIPASAYGCVGPCSDDCPSAAYLASLDSGSDRTVAQPQNGAPTCFDVDSALGLWEYTGPVAHQNRCTSDQIAAMATACFGVNAVGEDASAPDDASTDASIANDAGAPCAIFEMRNADCAECVNGAAYDGGSYNPSPVVIPVSADSAESTINVAGCVATLSTANATCKQNYETLSFCAHTACSVCPASEMQGCLSYAMTEPYSVCTQMGTVDPTCNTLVTSVPMIDQQTQCASDSTSFATEFSIVANTMCGP